MAGLFFTGCGKTPEQKVEVANQELKDAIATIVQSGRNLRPILNNKSQPMKQDDAFKEKMGKADSKTKAKYNKAVRSWSKKSRPQKEVRRI